MIIWGQNAASESASTSYGIEKEGEASKVKNANFAFSHDKNARDFDNLSRGIVNKEPVWEVKDKRGNVVETVTIGSPRDIKVFFDKQDIQNGGKGLIGFSRRESKTTSTGGPAKGTNETQAQRLARLRKETGVK